MFPMSYMHTETPEETEPKFNPFSGAGRRLDGKPLKYEPPPVSTSVPKVKQPDTSNGGSQTSAGSSSQSTSRQSQGKLVFGSHVNRGRDPSKVLYLYLVIFFVFLIDDVVIGS